MREFKFRAWDKDDKKMYKVVSISNSRYGECEQSRVTMCALDKDPTLKETKILESFNYDLMQYTGEKDVSGKEIYEGDIVEFITERYHGTKEVHPKIFRSEVRYIEGGFVITESNEWDTWLCAMTQGKDMLIEVVGNIFENKELLEQEC